MKYTTGESSSSLVNWTTPLTIEAFGSILAKAFGSVLANFPYL